MKYLALYLPQYHSFPENDEWWGEGYTEWTAVQKARPLFKGHYEPRVPMNKRYYDLKNDGYNTWKWQSEIASQYGIYGFCIYQYWFCGKQLMERPAEILLENPDIKTKFCFCWANETWTRTWYGLQDEILIEQTYGDKEDWEKHFNYLLPFFKDDRYIKIDGKPMYCIYRAQDIERMPEMLETWNYLAKINGLQGIYLVAGQTGKGTDRRENLYDGYYNFEPGLTISKRWTGIGKKFFQIRNHTISFLNKRLKTNYVESKIKMDSIMAFINGDDAKSDIDKNAFLGAFPQWDNTPRRDYKGLAYIGSTKEAFKKQLLRIKQIDTRDDPFVFINAWNEWGEGCYLEPDEVQGYCFLEAIKEISENL